MTFKRNGVREWIFQRFSNLLIIVYACLYIGLFLSIEEMTYSNWLAMHSALWFKVVSTFTLVVVMLNALLAGWQIGTDYTQKVPLAWFTGFFHGFYASASLAFIGLGLKMLWF